MWLDRYATYSGSDPRRTPSVLSVTPYVEQRFGAWWVRGGLRRLGDALLERCRALGVAVHLDSAVAGITTAGRRVSGVRLADGRRGARGRRRVRRRRPRPLRAAAARRGGGGPRPPGPCCAAHRRPGGVRPAARPRRRARRPARAPRLVPGRLRRRVRRAVPPARRPCPTRPSTCTPRPTRRWRPPAARRGSCWSTPRCTTRPAASTGTRRACASATRTGCWRCWRAAARTSAAGSAGGRSARRPTSSATPRAPGGAIYGTASHGLLAALLRPANRSPVPGLYLVGGSAHPGGGLPIVALSAKIVADLVGPA